MRNILAKVPHKEKRRFAAHLKQIWLQPDRKSARRAANNLAQEYEERFAEAIRCLEEGLEDSLQFYSFPEIDPKKISSPIDTLRTGAPTGVTSNARRSRKPWTETVASFKLRQ
jgi:transposase-like protein